MTEFLVTFRALTFTQSPRYWALSTNIDKGHLSLFIYFLASSSQYRVSCCVCIKPLTNCNICSPLFPLSQCGIAQCVGRQRITPVSLVDVAEAQNPDGFKKFLMHSLVLILNTGLFLKCSSVSVANWRGSL